MTEMGDEERGLERGGGLVKVDLDETDEGLGTAGEGIVTDGVAARQLHNGRFEGEDGSFA